MAERVSFSTSCLFPSFTRRNDISSAAESEALVWLGVVQAARDDHRIGRGHRKDAKHNQVFHFIVSLGFLGIRGDFPVVRRAAAVLAVRARMTPNVTPAVMRFRRAHKPSKRRLKALYRDWFLKVFRDYVRKDGWAENLFPGVGNHDHRRIRHPPRERFEHIQALQV